MEGLAEEQVVPGDEGVRMLRAGFSCAESVVIGLAPYLPAELRHPQRLATAFGGGVARRGLLCGVVAGAAVALGAALGRTSAQDVAARDRVFAATDRVVAELERRFGGTSCRQLTGLDFTSEADRAEWSARVQEGLCVHLVRAAVELTAAELERAGLTPRDDA